MSQLVILANVFLLSVSLSASQKNLILMIPDGCGISHMTLARWVKGGALAQDSMQFGALVRTYSANSIITGSAAAATAMATGFKVRESENAKTLGLIPDSVQHPSPTSLPLDKQWSPIATILEAAKLTGRSTGLVATAQVCHATPAGFATHWNSRDNYNVLIKQMVYSEIDVVFGGGRKYMLPTADGGSREDGENLISVLKNGGYAYVNSRNELLALPSSTTRVWGLFSEIAMTPDWNRPIMAPEEPTLAEMTSKAIDLLSKNESGFFLMVEGSQVDWASHKNDPSGVVSEYLSFDEAVSVALRFARKNSNTAVLVVPDHDNGGLSIGAKNGKYIESDFKTVIAPFANKNFNVPCSTVSRQANLGWTTGGHDGSDVPVFCHGVSFPYSSIENTDIAKKCEEWLDLNLKDATDELYQDVSLLIKDNKGFSIKYDTAGVKIGLGKVTVSYKKKNIEFPFGKNIAIYDKKVHKLKGKTIYSALSKRVFICRDRIKILMEKN